MKKIKAFFKAVTQNIAYYLWMLFVFSIVTLLYDDKSAFIELLFTFVLSAIYVIFKYKKKSKLFSYIKSMNIPLDETEFKTLTDFSVPVVIIKRNGIVEWYNESFSKICDSANIHKLPLSDFISSFDINNFEKCDNEESKIVYKISHNGKSYDVKGDIIHADTAENDNENYYIVMCWYDCTEYEILKSRYYSESFVSCIIVIDNFDDMMQGTANADKPRLAALIEENLDSIAQEAKGILKKYEKDKFLLYMQKSYLDYMIKTGFSFVEKFKTILVGNKVPPTLSIGIGTDGDDFTQNDSFAYSALDMALSRGGDQVVIKDKKQYRFYGGKSKETEKRTRVKARVVSQALKEMILESDQIIIMGHKYSDVDVLGSSLGINAIIKSLGKSSKILIDSYNQTVERFIKKYASRYSEIFINRAYANEIVNSNTLLFVVDTQKSTMVEEPALLDVCKNIIVIDHHRKSNDFIKNALISYHEPYASSASELVTEMLSYVDDLKIEISDAEALYAGIFMDTKNFTFKTGVRTFEAASYLRRIGVDTIEVKKLFQIDLNTFVKKWAIIENARTYHNCVAIATCEKNDSDMQTIVAQAADELLNITGITSAFVVCDMGGETIVSARSLGDMNVQFITEKLGGGGHMTIAGAQIENTSTDDVVNMLKKAIDEYLS